MLWSHLHVKVRPARATLKKLSGHDYLVAVTGSASRSLLQKSLCVALVGQIQVKVQCPWHKILKFYNTGRHPIHYQWRNDHYALYTALIMYNNIMIINIMNQFLLV